MRQLATLLAFLLSQNLATAQALPNFWQALPESQAPVLPETAERKIFPNRFKLFRGDFEALAKACSTAPMEFTEAARQQPLLLQLPDAEGRFSSFRIWESPVMAPALAANYPDIRTFAGQAADGSGRWLRLGYGHKGFYAFTFSPEGDIQSLRPFAEGDKLVYMAYRVSDLPKNQALSGTEAQCGTTGEAIEFDFEKSAFQPQNGAADRGAGEVILKKYRTTITAQGEYSQFHGGTVPLVMSAIVEGLNFITAIYENEFSARLELVPNNDTLIYLNPAQDPFFGALVTSWIDLNVAPTNQRIGADNYDIGQVWGRVLNPPGGVYVAGLATIAGVCELQNKARAGSSLPDPIGESFYLIAAHEMGHQFSATHTFNSCPPSADARTGVTAYEPGSGSTIMSYAGTCDPDNVTNNSDAYFHIASIEQARNFIENGNGSTCGQPIATGNLAPTASINLPNDFYIPIETPFEMTGTPTDLNPGDNLTHNWEQLDRDAEAPLGQPVGNGPSFRSVKPGNSPTRTFPRIETVVSGQPNKTEVLPTYDRTFKFRYTVRDNVPGAGGLASAQVNFRATAEAGPFVVSSPNATTDKWTVGDYGIVTWDVANTDKAPVNCQTVNIRLSLDGGFTYPLTLATGVPNNGLACVLVPNSPTSNARVRVQAADNIFFDISNANFKIEAPTQPGFGFCVPNLINQICTPQTFKTTVQTIALNGFSGPIALSVTSLPAGATATFSNPSVSPGGSSDLTIEFPANVPEGTYVAQIAGQSGAIAGARDIRFTVVNNDFSALVLTAPTDGVLGQTQLPAFTWGTSPDANTYEFQLATSPSFASGTIVASKSDLTTGAFALPAPLEKGKAYYWRVRPLNECGPGPWTEANSFSTLVEACATYAANDLPKNLTTNGTPTIESKITIPAGGAVSDVNIEQLKGFHGSFKQLEVHLINPQGTDVLLFRNKCGSIQSTFNMGIDDAATSFPCPPPNNLATPAKSQALLSAFNGQNAAGTWTLQVKDTESGSGGSIEAFQLELCSASSLNPPFIVNNNVLQLPGGQNAPIGDGLLKADDADNTATELVFTLVSKPKYGALYVLGSEAEAGRTFTQTDINTGALRYYDFGLNTGVNDDFRFLVTDGEGGFVSGKFLIQPSSVGTNAPLAELAFNLAPNPAEESVQVNFGRSLPQNARVSVFSMAGQMLVNQEIGSGATSARLDLAALPEGVYAVLVESLGLRGVRKLVIGR